MVAKRRACDVGRKSEKRRRYNDLLTTSAISQKNDVVITTSVRRWKTVYRRRDHKTTYLRRCNDVVCLLGIQSCLVETFVWGIKVIYIVWKNMSSYDGSNFRLNSLYLKTKMKTNLGLGLWSTNVKYILPH